MREAPFLNDHTDIPGERYSDIFILFVGWDHFWEVQNLQCQCLLGFHSFFFFLKYFTNVGKLKLCHNDEFVTRQLNIYEGGIKSNATNDVK